MRVFLCHSSSDKTAIRRLYSKLRTRGFHPWLDEEDLIPGQVWEQEITKAVRSSDVVIVCLSSNSINKEGYVQREILYALDIAEEKPEGTIFLIPLRLEQCDVPTRLRRWQWVDLPAPGGYEKLLRALRARAKTLGDHSVISNFNTIPPPVVETAPQVAPDDLGGQAAPAAERAFASTLKLIYRNSVRDLDNEIYVLREGPERVNTLWQDFRSKVLIPVWRRFDAADIYDDGKRIRFPVGEVVFSCEKDDESLFGERSSL